MAALSPSMQEALAQAQEHGSLVYRKGGFWTTPDAQPVTTATHYTPWDTYEWHTTKGTVRALVARGLLQWSRTEQYPDFDSAAALPKES